MRNIGIAILIVIVAVLAIVAAIEHQRANYAMPLVQASFLAPQPPMLLAPCPIGPRNFPRFQERKA